MSAGLGVGQRRRGGPGSRRAVRGADKVRRVRRRTWLLLLALAVLGATCYVQATSEAHRSKDLADQARSRVHAGMPLDEAMRELRAADGLWRHADCGYSSSAASSRHIFLYGSRDLDRTGVVTVDARGPRDRQVVTFVGSMENYLLGAFADCRQVDLPSTE